MLQKTDQYLKTYILNFVIAYVPITCSDMFYRDPSKYLS
jgi:hypothetical protein